MVLMVMAILGCVAMVMVILGSWFASVHAVWSAADMTALAGAHAQEANQDACHGAQRVAEMNGVDLDSCQVTTGFGEYVVVVTVSMPLNPQLPGAPPRVAYQATAGVVSEE